MTKWLFEKSGDLRRYALICRYQSTLLKKKRRYAKIVVNVSQVKRKGMLGVIGQAGTFDFVPSYLRNVR